MVIKNIRHIIIIGNKTQHLIIRITPIFNKLITITKCKIQRIAIRINLITDNSIIISEIIPITNKKKFANISCKGSVNLKKDALISTRNHQVNNKIIRTNNNSNNKNLKLTKIKRINKIKTTDKNNTPPHNNKKKEKYPRKSISNRKMT